MAVDTAQRRVSASQILIPFPPVILPDGTLDQPDRQSAAMVYPGIAAGLPTDTNSSGWHRLQQHRENQGRRLSKFRSVDWTQPLEQQTPEPVAVPVTESKPSPLSPVDQEIKALMEKAMANVPFTKSELEQIGALKKEQEQYELKRKRLIAILILLLEVA